MTGLDDDERDALRAHIGASSRRGRLRGGPPEPGLPLGPSTAWAVVGVGGGPSWEGGFGEGGGGCGRVLILVGVGVERVMGGG